MLPSTLLCQIKFYGDTCHEKMVTKQRLNLFVTISVSLDIFRQNKTALYSIIFI